MPRIAELGHTGLWVKDLPRMKEFYTRVLGLQVTDEDEQEGMVFLSSRPEAEHHELVLARGRVGGPDTKVTHQISWRVPDLEDVIAFHERFRKEGIQVQQEVTHGNAVGIYFFDPEGNRNEVYWQTGRDVRQPFRKTLNLDQTADAVLAESDGLVAAGGPAYQPVTTGPGVAIWDGLLTPDEQQVFDTFIRPKPLGKRPAVLVVDVNYAFVGLRPEAIVDSVKDYRTSCGERGWRGVENIRVLLEVARNCGVPIMYTTGINATRRGAHWANRARADDSLHLLLPDEREHARIGNRIVDEIAPQPGDVVIEKRGASGFFGTPLVSYLNELDVDTVIVTGTTTSGCVRASVVDAACHNYYVGIVEDCCFDRFDISHRVSLMDMHAKYGQVVSLAAAREYLRSADAALAPAVATALA